MSNRRPFRLLPFKIRSGKPSSVSLTTWRMTSVSESNAPDKRRTLGDKLQRLAQLHPEAVRVIEMRVDRLLYEYEDGSGGSETQAPTRYPR